MLLKAAMFFPLLILVLPAHAITHEPRRLFSGADTSVVTYPTGPHLLFFKKPSEIYWLDNSAHSVSFAKGRTAFDKWCYKLTHPASHIREPWGAARARQLYFNPQLKSFAVAPDASLYFLADGTPNINILSRGTLSQLHLDYPFTTPKAIAVSATNIFISDAGAAKILIYSLGGSLVQSITTGSHSAPDRLILSGSNLYGMSFSEGLVSRYSYRPPVSQGASAHKLLSYNALLPDPSRELPIGTTVETLTIPREQTLLSDPPPIDFAVYNQAIYILQPHQLLAVSFSGGGLRRIDIEGLFGPVTSLAASQHGIVFSEPQSGNFHLLQATIPVTAYIRGTALPEDIAAIYTYLYSRGLLPTHSQRFGSQTEFEGALASRYITSPQAISTFCRLNEFSAANCLDDVSLDDDIELPDLAFRPYTATTKVSLPLSTSPPQQYSSFPAFHTLQDVATSLSGTKEPSALEKELLRLNKHYQGSDILNENQGVFYTATRAVQVDFFASSRRSGQDLHTRLGLSRESTIAIQVIPAIQSELPLLASNQLAGVHSATPDTLSKQPASWLKLINADPKLSEVATDVAVVDFNFDIHHPLFLAGQFQLYNPTQGVSHNTETVSAANGDPEHPLPITTEDHGTHIAGLIAGQSAHGQWFGVTPSAHIWGVQIDDFVTAVQHDDFSIFNISLGEGEINADNNLTQFNIKSRNILQSWIDQISGNTTDLFVIAAGNEESSNFRNRLAGLGINPNVITVSATEKSGNHLWVADGTNGTNHGYPTVSLEAPGEDLVSGTYHNAWGIASGTSQAAALVSGAASLLRGSNNFDPWQIKQRLISTSQLLPWLNFNLQDSVGGLLDVSRAVHDADKIVVDFQNLEGHSCVGRQNKTQARGSLVLYKMTNPTTITLHFEDIRRIHNDTKSHTYTIWYSEVPIVDNPNPRNPEPPSTLTRRQFTLDNLTDPYNPSATGNGDFAVAFSADDHDCAVAQSNLVNIKDIYNGFYRK